MYRVIASLTDKEGRWCEVSAFEAISIMLSFGIFIITLLAYIESRHKRK
ncbi:MULTISPECIES: putative holin-like toxin [Blautia]|nr:putative holin-like toxin [Blautia marasmi]